MDYVAVLERLDRRYEYVREFNGQAFLLELFRFVTEVLEEETTQSAMATFVDHAEHATKLLREQSRKDRAVFKRIFPQVLTLVPAWQAELTMTSAHGAENPCLAEYLQRTQTLQFVQDLVDGKELMPQRESVGPRQFDRLSEDQAFEMLIHRLNDLDGSIQSHPAFDEILNELVNAREQRNHVVRGLRLYEPTEAYTALKTLLDVVRALNPDPLVANSRWERIAAIQNIHPFDAQWGGELRAVAFKGQAFPRDEEPKLKEAVTRFYHHLRLNIDQEMAWDITINRYKQRAQWYDRHRLIHVADQGEDALSDDLARFLFDRGVPVLLRHSFGGHTPDLVGPEKAGLLIESKLYRTDCRDELVKGVAQLISYMQTLDGTDYTARVGYLVVFRVAGPLYTFEAEFRAGSIVVRPVLIDIALGGGRARSRVRTITTAEVLNEDRVSGGSDPD